MAVLLLWRDALFARHATRGGCKILTLSGKGCRKERLHRSGYEVGLDPGVSLTLGDPRRTDKPARLSSLSKLSSQKQRLSICHIVLEASELRNCDVVMLLK